MTEPTATARVSESPRAFIPYEIPLRPGVTARLVLPVDLTIEEGERLCAVIKSLAFDLENRQS